MADAGGAKEGTPILHMPAAAEGGVGGEGGGISSGCSSSSSSASAAAGAEAQPTGAADAFSSPAPVADVAPLLPCQEEAVALLNCVAAASFNQVKCTSLMLKLRQCTEKKNVRSFDIVGEEANKRSGKRQS
eukprot:TRINITY_DN17553_c0_g1_i1.p1 TRINITY_DN17553_c0_g1~~TRINITY_DN17553_c0_g1_i1.p1  ORF type:complete len:148 (+),score=53.14 TRINITY_DN17553_c0_g1_i1:53-445(+)